MEFDLKSFRRDLKLKQLDLQEILGVTQGFISRIENLKESFPLNYLDILSERFGEDIVSRYVIKKTEPYKDGYSVCEKLKFVRAELDLSQKDLADKLGITQPQYSLVERGISDFQLAWVSKLIELGVSPVWFLSPLEENIHDANKAFDLNYSEKKSITENRELPNINYSSGVPYYDVDFIGGFDMVLNDQTTTPAYLIDFQMYNSSDCWCNVTGHSMEPAISNGDIIALKEVQDWTTFLPFGEIYAIVTTEHRTIKKLSAGHNHDFFTLIPLNKSIEYQPQEIPKSIILKVYKVMGCMKKL